MIGTIIAFAILVAITWAFVYFVWVKPDLDRQNNWVQNASKGFPDGNSSYLDAPYSIQMEFNEWFENNYDVISYDDISEPEQKEAWNTWCSHFKS